VLPVPCYVLSDTHLGVASDETAAKVAAFIKQLNGRAASLLINGDLFDFWFEWRHVIPREGFRVLAAIGDLVDSGTPVLWNAGNHDCWGGDVLRKDLGISYHIGAWRGTIGTWETLVEHGDGLRRVEDRRYRALRTVIRNPWSIRAFRWLHPDVGSWLAGGSSRASRVYRAKDRGEGLRRIAHATLDRDRALDLVIFGHTHVAALERAPSGGVYANAGSWLDDPTYLRVEESRISLERWRGSPEGECLHSIDRCAEESLPQS